MKILKKVKNLSTTKQEVETLASEFSISINRTIKALGINKSSIYYIKKGYPSRRVRKCKPIRKSTQEAIKDLTSMNSTYGVPRVKAVLK